MKHTYVFGLVVLLTLASSCNKKEGESSDEQIRAMLVAGGHSFDTTEFVEMFDSFSFLSYDTVMQTRANRMIENKDVGNYDVLIFYDMWDAISESCRQAYFDLCEEGKGIVFLHHSLASYQEWDNYIELIGGRYVEASSESDSSLHSNFKHDIDLDIEILDDEHPLTKGMKDFSIHDEGYGNVQILKGVTPILKTSHPACSPVIAWTHKVKNSKIVYLMSGHDRKAYANPGFREILGNAIRFVSE